MRSLGEQGNSKQLWFYKRNIGICLLPSRKGPEKHWDKEAWFVFVVVLRVERYRDSRLGAGILEMWVVRGRSVGRTDLTGHPPRYGGRDACDTQSRARARRSAKRIAALTTIRFGHK